MSAACYIVLNSGEPGFDAMVDGKSLAASEEQLAEVAAKEGFRPLTDFFSLGEDELGMAAEVGFDEVLRLSGEAEETWYDPGEGLTTVRGLLKHGEGRFSREVLVDLRDFERVLTEAKQRGLSWHLAVDY